MSDSSLFDSDDDVFQHSTGNLFDDCDIIEDTPQKVKKKIVKSVAKKKFCILNETLVHPFCVNRNDCKSLVTFESQILFSSYKIPYVFYEIKDILSFTVFNSPSNPNIKLIGICNQKSSNMYILSEFRTNSKLVPSEILLNFELCSTLPKSDDEIEVYGFLKFQDNKVILVARFWIPILCNLKSYLNCLKKQRNFVPNTYTIVTKNKFNVTELSDSLNENSINYLFEEMDEFSLNKKLEYIEYITFEIEQLMNISDDIFK